MGFVQLPSHFCDDLRLLADYLLLFEATCLQQLSQVGVLLGFVLDDGVEVLELLVAL